MVVRDVVMSVLNVVGVRVGRCKRTELIAICILPAPWGYLFATGYTRNGLEHGRMLIRAGKYVTEF